MNALYNTPNDAKRAVRRNESWRRSHGDATPPNHIAANATQAERQLEAKHLPTTDAQQ
jgi:hypothetical protein